MLSSNSMTPERLQTPKSVKLAQLGELKALFASDACRARNREPYVPSSATPMLVGVIADPATPTKTGAILSEGKIYMEATCLSRNATQRSDLIKLRCFQKRGLSPSLSERRKVFVKSMDEPQSSGRRFDNGDMSDRVFGFEGNKAKWDLNRRNGAISSSSSNLYVKRSLKNFEEISHEGSITVTC